MTLNICKLGYYRLTADMCAEDMKDLRDLMEQVSDAGAAFSVEKRALALRWAALMNREKDMPQ